MAYREAGYDTESCLGCDGRVERGSELCPQCGAPVDVAKYAELELALKPALASARRALMIPAALFALFAMVACLAMEDGGMVLFPPFLALAVLFSGASVGVRSWPFFSTVLGLALFTYVETVNVIVDPSVLFPGLGLLLRVLMFVVLASGARAGYRARDLRRQARRHDLFAAGAVLVLAIAGGVFTGLAFTHPFDY
jgi:hypothetical protein